MSSNQTFLDSLFYPRSVAVVGVSAKPQKFGSRYLDALLSFGFKGKIYPINPTAPEILGLKCYRSVKEIPENVDVAFISVPAKLVPEVVVDCVDKKVNFVVIFSSGFSETGLEECKKLEEELLKIIKGSFTRLVGPNCFGIYCPSGGLTLLPGANFPRESGNVALISQSGGLAERFCLHGKSLGLRFSKVVSYGNALDINESDLLEYLINDYETRIIAMYIESIKDSKRFMKLVKEAAKVKPVIIWKGGLTDAGEKAAKSHTGAVAGKKEVWNAFFKQSGAIKAESFEDLVNISLIFQLFSKPCGRNVGIVCVGGGMAVASADVCENYGLRIPEFQPENVEKIRMLAQPVGVSLRNPVDLGSPFTPPKAYQEILKIAALDPQIDVLIVLVWHLPLFYSEKTFVNKDFIKKTLKAPIYVKKNVKKPIILVLYETPLELEMLNAEKTRRKIKDEYIGTGIPVYPNIEKAAKALAKFIEYHEFLEKNLKCFNT
ncbi:MAG: acetate--CoA ligase family protein [Candidatus Bathyarchaeota archaeon]